MTPAELAVERDRLLEGGRTLEEAETIQVLLEHPTIISDARLIAKHSEWVIMLGPGAQCPSCRRTGNFGIVGHNSRCDLVLATLRLREVKP